MLNRCFSVKSPEAFSAPEKCRMLRLLRVLAGVVSERHAPALPVTPRNDLGKNTAHPVANLAVACGMQVGTHAPAFLVPLMLQILASTENAKGTLLARAAIDGCAAA
mmetsp:Transcript_105718/g.170133  ORF Transcript_105718/g.170133 Transcript_105718/m.170133 type:complete len:107 (-) Transcript_105718:58-378(-)